MSRLLYQLALLSALEGLPQFLRERRAIARAAGRVRWRTLAEMTELSRQYSQSMLKDMPERAVFENRIIPFYQLSGDFRSIVIVGCEWQTPRYVGLLAHKQVWTIDPDPGRAHQGAQNHTVGPIRTLASIMPAGTADLVICNGSPGGLLPNREEAEQAIRAAFALLCPGGHLVIGHHDDGTQLPFDPPSLAAIAPFQPLVFEPLGVSEYRTGTGPAGYVYRFYRKADEAA